MEDKPTEYPTYSPVSAACEVTATSCPFIAVPIHESTGSLPATSLPRDHEQNHGHCIKCGQYAAALYCGRCQQIYCSKACQVTHWSTHKRSCIDIKEARSRYNKYLEHAMKRIEGNILLIAGGGSVTVNISETIDEFIGACSDTSSLHIAHISRDPSPGTTVRFILKNYTHTLDLPAAGIRGRDGIKKLRAPSDGVWSVIFEM